MAKEKSKISMSRININAPTSLVNRVKEYADNLGINTTSAYIVLLNQALDQKDTMNNLPNVISMFNQIQSLTSIEQDDEEENLLLTNDNEDE